VTRSGPLPSNLRIGELSARSGRTIHAIRWYEAQGLIPGVVRDTGGRRVYHEHHVDWLDLMDRLRSTGMSIAEMRAYTALVKQGRGTLKQRQEMLFAHRARVLQTISEWTQALKLIDSKIDYYGEWLTTGQRPRHRPEDRVKESEILLRGAAPKRVPRRSYAARSGTR
jgi:DNA-binding transcriptional MerR regulator